MDNKKTLAELFLADQDAGVLDASEKFAEWTLPTIFTRELYTDGKRMQLSRDYQSTGAQLVNTAATKIVGALFPQGTSFFRFSNGKAGDIKLELHSRKSYGITQDSGLYAHGPSFKLIVHLLREIDRMKNGEPDDS